MFDRTFLRYHFLVSRTFCLIISLNGYTGINLNVSSNRTCVTKFLLRWFWHVHRNFIVKHSVEGTLCCGIN